MVKHVMWNLVVALQVDQSARGRVSSGLELNIVTHVVVSQSLGVLARCSMGEMRSNSPRSGIREARAFAFRLVGRGGGGWLTVATVVLTVTHLPQETIKSSHSTVHGGARS